MNVKKHRVIFEPEGKTVYVLDDTTIYEATGKAGIIIKSECGGMGTCGSCVVNIIKGEYEQKGSEKFLSEEDIKKGTVLACRTSIKSDMVIEIPRVRMHPVLLFEDRTDILFGRRFTHASRHCDDTNIQRIPVGPGQLLQRLQCVVHEKIWRTGGLEVTAPIVAADHNGAAPSGNRAGDKLVAVGCLTGSAKNNRRDPPRNNPNSLRKLAPAAANTALIASPHSLAKKHRPMR